MNLPVEPVVLDRVVDCWFNHGYLRVGKKRAIVHASALDEIETLSTDIVLETDATPDKDTKYDQNYKVLPTITLLRKIYRTALGFRDEYIGRAALGKLRISS